MKIIKNGFIGALFLFSGYASSALATSLSIGDYLQANEIVSTAEPKESLPLVAFPVVQLLAIYGVGSKRLIELDVNGQRKVFMPGQRWALDEMANAQTLQLTKIEEGCVFLQYQSQSLKRCIAPKEVK